jgi:hypothetical protein
MHQPRLKHQPPWSSKRGRTAQTQRQRSASARRQRARMGSWGRSIRQIHSPPFMAGSTRSRNSALRWKDRASSPVPAVANTPYRQRACAAPCSLPQTSFCERASHRSFYLAVRPRSPSPSLGICVISGWIAFLHASLSSAFFSRRQIVISSALGMNALQSLSASGVHARRCSRVPCEERAGEAVADSKANDTHHCAKVTGRSVRSFLLFMFIIGLASIIEADTDIAIMADRNTLVPGFALVAKRQRLEL